MHRRLRCPDIADRDVGPIGQLASVLPGIIEQGRQHHRRQLDRYALDPVEGLVARQTFEHPDRPLADRSFHLGKVRWCHDWADHLALLVVLGRVHPDEALALQPLRRILDRDAADFGRVGAVVDLDLHDVLVFAHRPIRTVAALPAPMHRSLAAQAFEIRVVGVVLIKLRVADIDRLERQRIGVVKLRRH